MGFDNECIKDIQSLNGEFFCPVCRLLVFPDEAWKTPCGHLYCKACIAYVTQSTSTCPYDGMFVPRLRTKPLLQVDRMLADTIWRISVRCLYHKSGCTWEGTLLECLAHSSRCDFGYYSVNCSRCGVLILHMQMSEHLNFCSAMRQQAPPSQVTQLPQQPNQAPSTSHMQQILPSGERQDHEQNVCSEQHVTYSNAQITYLEDQLLGEDMDTLLDNAAANHNQPAYPQVHTGTQSFPDQQYMQAPPSYPPPTHPQPMHSQVACHAPSYAEQQQPRPQDIPQPMQMPQNYQTYPPMQPQSWENSNVFHPQTDLPMQNQLQPNAYPMVQGQSYQPPHVPTRVPFSAEPVLAHPPSLNNPSGLMSSNNLSGEASYLGYGTQETNGHVSIGFSQSQVMPSFPPAPASQLPVQRQSLPLQPPQVLNSGMTAATLLQSHENRVGHRFGPSNPLEGNGLPVENVKQEHDILEFPASSPAFWDDMPISYSPNLHEPTPRMCPSTSIPMPSHQQVGSGGGFDATKAHSSEEGSRSSTFSSNPNAIHGGGFSFDQGVVPSHVGSVESYGGPPQEEKTSIPNSSQLQQQQQAYSYSNGTLSKSSDFSSKRPLGGGFYPGELGPSNSYLKKKRVKTLCHVCNMGVEDLRRHSQTMQHRVAMDLLAKKQKTLMKPKFSNDHSPIDGRRYPWNGNPDDGHDNNGNAPTVQ